MSCFISTAFNITYAYAGLNVGDWTFWNESGYRVLFCIYVGKVAGGRAFVFNRHFCVNRPAKEIKFKRMRRTCAPCSVPRCVFRSRAMVKVC